MFWRDCNSRQHLLVIMEERELNHQMWLKLYADKIYNFDNLLTPAYSRRFGELQPFMLQLNGLMSRIRISIEWAFNEICSLFKYTGFKKRKRLC